MESLVRLLAPLFPLVLIAYAVRDLGRRAGALGAARASRRWPRAPGRVLWSAFEEDDAVMSPNGVRLAAVNAAVRYEYDAPGGRRTGERIRWTPLGPRAARAAAARYRAGAPVAVAYDPAAPDRAVLEPGTTPQGIAGALRSAALFALAGAWAWQMLVGR